MKDKAQKRLLTLLVLATFAGLRVLPKNTCVPQGKNALLVFRARTDKGGRVEELLVA